MPRSKTALSEQKINAAIERFGNMQSAADHLGIGRSTLYKAVKRFKEAEPKEQPAKQNGTVAAALAALAEAINRSHPTEPSAELLRGVKKRRAARKQKQEKIKEAGEEEEAEDDRPFAGGDDEPAEAKIGVLPGRRFVVTSAQNNTFVHAKFVAALKRFCELKGAQLLVGCFAYNKKGWSQPHRLTKEDDSLWYDPAITPHVCNEPMRLAPELIWCGNLEISPTAVDPLSGLDSYTKECSGIVPHTKMHAKPLPVPKGRKPRFMFTSGVCTKANYIRRKAGQKAEFHHTVGAQYVEVDEDGTHFVYQLIANQNGSFHLLNERFDTEGAQAERVAAIVWPDVHIEKVGATTTNALFVGDDSIRGVLRPERQVFHDVIHFGFGSHHADQDPFHYAEAAWRGTDSVEAEVDMSARFLADRDAEDDSRKYVIPSNHQDHPLKWLKNPKWAMSGRNARYWHYLNYRTHDAIMHAANENRVNDFDLFEFAVRDKVALPRTHFLRRDESLLVVDIECGMHGDVGANGSRGGLKQYSKLGVKTITGHKHSGEAWDGAWSVGAMELEQGYNIGPSSWSVTLIVIYASGKRSMITMHGTRWRAASIAKPRFRVKAPTLQLAA